VPRKKEGGAFFASKVEEAHEMPGSCKKGAPLFFPRREAFHVRDALRAMFEKSSRFVSFNKGWVRKKCNRRQTGVNLLTLERSKETEDRPRSRHPTQGMIRASYKSWKKMPSPIISPNQP
jgi:hypothetical protein